MVGADRILHIYWVAADPKSASSLRSLPQLLFNLCSYLFIAHDEKILKKNLLGMVNLFMSKEKRHTKSSYVMYLCFH